MKHHNNLNTQVDLCEKGKKKSFILKRSVQPNYNSNISSQDTVPEYFHWDHLVKSSSNENCSHFGVWIIQSELEKIFIFIFGHLGAAGMSCEQHTLLSCHSQTVSEQRYGTTSITHSELCCVYSPSFSTSDAAKCSSVFTCRDCCCLV